MKRKTQKKFLIQHSIQVIGNIPIKINKRASELEHNKAQHSSSYRIVKNCCEMSEDLTQDVAQAFYWCIFSDKTHPKVILCAASGRPYSINLHKFYLDYDD